MVLGDRPVARLDTWLRPGMMQCLSDWPAADHGRAAPLRAFTPSHCYHMSPLSRERDPGGPCPHGTAGLPRAPPPGGLLPHLPGGANGLEPLTPCQQGRGEGQVKVIGDGRHEPAGPWFERRRTAPLPVGAVFDDDLAGGVVAGGKLSTSSPRSLSAT